MTPKQKEALAWLAEHGVVRSWELRRRTGLQRRTFDALADQGRIHREVTTSRYTGLRVTTYTHPNHKEQAA